MMMAQQQVLQRLALLHKASRAFTASAASSASVFASLPEAPKDPILAITDAWRADPFPGKINLGVGAYRTEEGKPLVLSVVRKAAAAIANDPAANKEYGPITGNAAFCKLAREMAFGTSHPAITEKHVATVQCLSGTGSLRVGAELLAIHYPVKKVLVASPTWPTHKTIFGRAGLQVGEYRYFDKATRGVDIKGLLEDLNKADEGTVVVLHACAHNPTGADPTMDQWKQILEVVQRRKLLPFFDSAYQGFASGDLEADAAPIRLFASAKQADGSPQELLLAQSFAKNMGLYGERVGALSVVTSSPDLVPKAEGQLRLVIRPMYSNPPRHGAEIAARVLGDPQLFEEWKVELRGMAERIKDMRVALLKELRDQQVPGDWSFVTKQIGMFTYTGLSRGQCEVLTNKHHIYLTMDGRISMAGLNSQGAAKLATAMKDALATAK